MAHRTIFDDEIDNQNLDITNLHEELIIKNEEVEDNCSQNLDNTNSDDDLIIKNEEVEDNCSQNLDNTNSDDDLIKKIEEVEYNCSQDHMQEKENQDLTDTNSDTECSTKDSEQLESVILLGSQLTKTNEISIECEGNIGLGKPKGKQRNKTELEMFGTDKNKDDDSQDDVSGDKNKKFRKYKLTKTEQQFTEYEEQPGPPSPSPLLPPPPPGHSRQIRQDDDKGYALNYGSDPDSDESGDDEQGMGHPRVLSRTLQIVMETPLDEDFGGGGDDDAPAADAEGVAPTATDQPRRWYDFEWKEFPNSSIRPESRRETFSQTNVGPTTPRDDPYDIFLDIWDRTIMEYIASETNKYAQRVTDQLMGSNNLHPKSRIKKWRDTTADELYVFFGLLLAMGVVVKSRLEEYWSTTSDIFVTPAFSAYMSINRFLLLSKCLHFNDIDDMCGLDLDTSEARLFKIQPILSHLNKKFQELYTPAQNIALDESLMMGKGWPNIGQLIPNKTAKKVIKTYEICESQTGYLWRFEVHAHKKSTSPPQQFEDPLEAPTPSIVLRLIQGLEHKGYTLWMDNFYNSPCLARRLKSLGVDCVGTLRTDRKFVPQALHNLTKENMRLGQIVGLTSGDVDVMVWRYTNRVATISTYHGNSVQPYGSSTKPTLILDYNIMMGGVDKKDQLLAMYPVERKHTTVWYKKLFRRLLNVSVLNSYIIHHHSSSLTHLNFRISLIKSLLSRHRPILIPHNVATAQNRRFVIPAQQVGEVYDARVHRIGDLAKQAGGTRRLRRNCVICKKRAMTVCVGCDKTICITDCFLALHS